ncbi:hypothetical protein [Necropsobacter massiliensis]|uniref:RraA family protein n=1 Tax=Necropsobacter massiliensis TaxID=1400001 RepID=UPI0005099ACF|nr:hypothetical protein [Necropsobacter massiliensis]
MKNVGFRIIKNFTRTSSHQLEKFRDIPVSVLDDSMNRTAAISSQFFAVNDKLMLGTAYTVRVQGGDNLLFYYAIAQAKKGDVIVVDGGGFNERALCGEIMAQLAKARELAGFIIYGAIRDKKELEKIDFPVFACASTPNGPYKNGPGEINVPVNIGGRIIFPGDIIVGDESGVISIRPKDAEDVLIKAAQIAKKEQQMLAEIHTNKNLNIDWVYDKLAQSGCEFIDEEVNYDNYL